MQESRRQCKHCCTALPLLRGERDSPSDKRVLSLWLQRRSLSTTLDISSLLDQPALQRVLCLKTTTISTLTCIYSCEPRVAAEYWCQVAQVNESTTDHLEEFSDPSQRHEHLQHFSPPQFPLCRLQGPGLMFGGSSSSRHQEDHAGWLPSSRTETEGMGWDDSVSPYRMSIPTSKDRYECVC